MSRLNNSSWLTRFYNQAWVTPRVAHSSIAQVFDANTAGKHRYLVIDYVDGHDLQAIVGVQGPLEHQFAVDFIRHAARALAHAHERGHVHRDIKPNHLMVDATGAIVLLDWSVARIIGKETAPLTAVDEESIWSTLDYLAPQGERIKL